MPRGPMASELGIHPCRVTQPGPVFRLSVAFG